MRIWPGHPYPLGATWDGEGVNFALFSENATAVELCLFDGPDAAEDSQRVMIEECTDYVWHVYLPEVRPGAASMATAFMVLMSRRPDIVSIPPNSCWIPMRRRSPAESIGPNPVRIQHRRPPGGSSPQRRRQRQTYAEMRRDRSGLHLGRRPITANAVGSDGDLRTACEGLYGQASGHSQNLRGTYAGLATPAVIEHLQNLGVTAVELLPVHHFIRDKHLVDRGLTNYWGYNSIGFFAPDSQYATTSDRAQQVWEFKTMVKAFHSAGIEVILDVVYNHTGEGSHLGPTFRFAASTMRRTTG